MPIVLVSDDNEIAFRSKLSRDERDGLLENALFDFLALTVGLLAELKEMLPSTVDALTPDGRLPDDKEAARWG